MGSTPTFGLPYPDTGSSVDYPRDLKASMDRTEAVLLTRPVVYPITVTSGYGALPGAYGAASARMDGDGIIHLSGGMLRTAATASGVTQFGIGDLPAQVRSVKGRRGVAASLLGPVVVDITVAGAITLIYPSPVSIVQGAWTVLLDGVTFAAAD